MRRASKLRPAGLAFFALFFLVLQPVCASYERHLGTPQVNSAATARDAGHADHASHGSDDSTLCCSDVRADAIASSTSAAAEKNFPIAQMLTGLPLALVNQPRLTLSSHTARGTSPPQALSYYARSARLLR
jgi:hypothetical protein